MEVPAVLGVPRHKPEVGVLTIKALLGNPYKENTTIDHLDPNQEKAVREDE